MIYENIDPGNERARATLPDEAQIADWPDPQEIKTEPLPVPPLPEALIPHVLLQWVKDIAHRMQTPLEFAATAALVVAGALVGTVCGIRPKTKDNWMVVPNMWGGIVARPGKLKSPSLDEATKPLTVLETAAKEKYEEQLKIYDAEFAEFDARKKALAELIKELAKEEESGKRKNSQTQTKTMADLKNQMAALSEPVKPTQKRYKANDATVPKLHELLSTNPRGIVVVRDELVGLLASLDKDDKQEDKAFYLQAWNGYGDFTYDRIGRGSINVPNVCVSVFGGIQPDKIRNYLYTAMRKGQDDGLVQRFQMMVYPDDVAWKYVDEVPDSAAKDNALKVLVALAGADFPNLGASQEPGAIAFFRFTDEAQEYFKVWLTELETQKLKGQEEPVIQEHLSKYRSLMPSLALIFHLLDVCSGAIPPGDITLQSAEMAASWCDFLEAHARRIYGLVVNVRLKAALSLADKLKKRELQDGFNARAVYRHGWTYLTTAEDAEAALNELVLHNWLAEREEGKTVRYTINPKIYKQ